MNIINNFIFDQAFIQDFQNLVNKNNNSNFILVPNANGQSIYKYNKNYGFIVFNDPFIHVIRVYLFNGEEKPAYYYKEYPVDNILTLKNTGISSNQALITLGF